VTAEQHSVLISWRNSDDRQPNKHAVVKMLRQNKAGVQPKKEAPITPRLATGGFLLHQHSCLFLNGQQKLGMHGAGECVAGLGGPSAFLALQDCHIFPANQEHLDRAVQLSQRTTRRSPNALGEKRIPGQGIRLLVSCAEHR
jgi:hypothetical protein